MSSNFREEVYVGPVDEAAFVCSLLEAEGIAIQVFSNQYPRGIGRIRSICVLNEAQAEHARDIVAQFKRGEGAAPPKSYRSWRCPHCNELIEGQFAACWKCGQPKRD